MLTFINLLLRITCRFFMEIRKKIVKKVFHANVYISITLRRQKNENN